MVDRNKAELPSAKSERQAKEKVELTERINDEQLQLRRAFAMTFKTQHGKVVLHWLMKECGYNNFIIGADYRGDIDEKRSTFGAMRLNLYIRLRKLLPVHILQEVEYHDHQQ